jgi:hypothetical protein
VLQGALKAEGVQQYDLVYMTQNDRPEDHLSFERLSHAARRKIYLNVRRFEWPDVLNHLGAWWNLPASIRRMRYERVVLSSFDNLAFKKLALQNPEARIVTFDDGAGYINHQADYLVYPDGWKARLIRALWGVPDNKAFIRRVQAHYTIYGKFRNIMPTEISSTLSRFPVMDEWTEQPEPGLVYFIGQPSGEMGTPRYVQSLKQHLLGRHVDVYVKHPRETEPLRPDLPLLDKQGEIAEVALMRHANGRRPHIIAAFSSVLFNLDAQVADKTMLLDVDSPHAQTHAQLARQAGCEVVLL